MSSFEEPIVGYSSSDIDSENHSENIFQKLPDELIGVIFEYLTSVELIFSVAKVCKYWSNEVVFPIMKEQYKTFIAEIYHHNKEEENEFKILSMIDFYSKRQGQRFVKHMLRKCVFNYAAQLQKHIHHVNNDDRVVECNPSWLDNDLSILKHYFLHFSDVREGTLFKPFNSNNSNVTTQTTNTSGGGIFKGVLDYMASLFGGNKSNSTVSSNSTSNTTTNKQSNEKIVPKSKTDMQEYDYLFKALLEGNYGAGKTSFLRASLLDIPPTSSQAFTTIGIDFGLRMFVLGDSCKVKLQMWDQFGPGRFRSITASYYRGASVIYCLIDLTDQNQWLESKIRCICEHAPDGAEIIVIGTKADLHDKRKMLRRDLEKLAFETFKGSLYLEITNMKIEEPQTVVLYSVLFRYLLSANKMTSEKK